MNTISPFDMSCAQVHWVGSKPICRVMQLKLHKPTMAIGYSLRMCAQNVDSTNPGRSNLVFRSKPIAEAEMSNRLIVLIGRRKIKLMPLCYSPVVLKPQGFGRGPLKYKHSCRVQSD